MWIDEAKSVPFGEAATMVGLQQRRGRSWGPCPCCNADQRGSTDKRGPIGVRRDGNGWMCHPCGAKGDVVDIVSASLSGGVFRAVDKEAKISTREWFQRHGYSAGNYDRPRSPAPVMRDAPRDRPPEPEVRSLWSATTTVVEALGQEREYSGPLSEWMFERRFHPETVDRLGMIRVMPQAHSYQWPAWWPHKWARFWRLATPAYEISGKFVSLHARSVNLKQRGPKTIWPREYEAGGLFLANRRGVMVLRGEHKEIAGLIICEGLTDLIRASIATEEEDMDMAILSGVSGSFKSLSKLRIPKSLKVYIATDPDKQGNEYAQTIIKHLKTKLIYRLHLGQ